MNDSGCDNYNLLWTKNQGQIKNKKNQFREIELISTEGEEDQNSMANPLETTGITGYVPNFCNNYCEIYVKKIKPMFLSSPGNLYYCISN